MSLQYETGAWVGTGAPEMSTGFGLFRKSDLTPESSRNTTAVVGALIYTARRSLARWIAPADMLFSSHMSLELDRLTVEVERLRKLLARGA